LEIKNCKQCGKIYLYNGSSLCKDCMDEMEQYFAKIRDYLYRYPDSDVDTIANETGIDTKLILQLIRDGRLQFGGRSRLTCRACGDTIETGYYCVKCQQEISKKLKITTGENTPKEAKQPYHTRLRER
jgi:hypothetical protein